MINLNTIHFKNFQMKNLLFVLGLLLIIGCNNSSKKSNSTEQLNVLKEDNDKYASSKWVALQKKKSLVEGNFNAYGNLIDYYNNTPSEYYELLPISIIMADKYKCDNARAAIYFWFLEMQNDGRDEKQFFKLDKSKQDFILKYLLDGAKNKNPGCMAILNKLLKCGLKIDKEIES